MLDLRQPRVVLVTRKTQLTLLVEHHGTLRQAQFFLEQRGQRLEEYQQAHERFEEALDTVMQALPSDQRRTRLDRGDLDRFLFAGDDVVLIVGQDGLVANVAKYLRGQTTIGVNPDPQRYDGVLCAHGPADVPRLLRWAKGNKERGLTVQHRAMALAERDDGVRLYSLNEVFIGHRTHQSARYRITSGASEERQSSSGIICSTGTGCTGWARSIREQRHIEEPFPQPEEKRLVWFVREPFPSVYTGTSMNLGFVERGDELVVTSEMGEGGVVFADGVEADRLDFLDGHLVKVTLAPDTLNLVVPTKRGNPAIQTKRKGQAEKHG